ncbi:hypothetical protein BGZ49_007923 [Haplosporangium sp. Z 27]|nr:hypothetical protein BGZ49_007923 [Haplosporangium sp. Z 27]
MSPPGSHVAIRSLTSATKSRIPSVHFVTKRFLTDSRNSQSLHSAATNCNRIFSRTISTPSCAIKTLPSGASRLSIPSLAASANTSSFHTSAITKDKHPAGAAQKRPETRSCWKCSTPVPYLTLICTNPDCKSVQSPAPSANYFEILGLSPEPTFDVDLKDLRIKFFKIQQQIHPDSFNQSANRDQIHAQQQSSLANKAYSTLKSPLSRANYILDILGSPIQEAESLDEPELLMEVMEARELLEDAQTQEEVEELKNTNDGKLKL